MSSCGRLCDWARVSPQDPAPDVGRPAAGVITTHKGFAGISSLAAELDRHSGRRGLLTRPLFVSAPWGRKIAQSVAR